ncbi:MAG: OsmC family protein [Pseudomonadota bacterium]
MKIFLTKDDQGGLRQRITIAKHTIFADAPKELGGEESAPDPHDLFDTALAACKALTITMYARHKNWPLEHVDIKIQRDPKEERKGIYHLSVFIELFGKLDGEQRIQLLAIGDKCPVHKLMTSTEIIINTQLI